MKTPTKVFKFFLYFLKNTKFLELMISFGHENYKNINVDDILGGDNYSLGDFDDADDNFKENELENFDNEIINEKLSIENQRRCTTQSVIGFTQIDNDSALKSIIMRDSYENPISQMGTNILI